MLVKTLMKTPAVTIAEDQPVWKARELMRREGQTDLVVPGAVAPATAELPPAE